MSPCVNMCSYCSLTGHVAKACVKEKDSLLKRPTNRSRKHNKTKYEDKMDQCMAILIGVENVTKLNM